MKPLAVIIMYKKHVLEHPQFLYRKWLTGLCFSKSTGYV